MSLSLQLYWSFRSPYSYIVLPRIVALARDYDLTVELRVVHPAALRNPDYFRHMNPIARPYHWLDSARAAMFLGIPFRRPVPDPILQDPVTLAVATDQPHARRLGRLGVAATERGRGLAFCEEVSRVLWDGTVDGWDQGNHLARASARAGLDLDELEAAITADPHHYEKLLEDNDKRLHAAGHWGVPTMVFRDEPFFGQDRFDLLVWRLQQHGLARR